MQLIKVAAGVLNQTPIDWDNNKKNILALVKEAKEQNVSILVLPELSITGYGCEDAFLSEGILERAFLTLEEIKSESKGLILSVGLPILYQNAVFNCGALLVDGEIAGFVAKKHLAGDGIHYEPRWFKAWPQGVSSFLERDGKKYPLGDIIFNCGGVKIGFEICEDAWVAVRPGSSQALKGVDLILNPSASHFAFGKIDIRNRFVIEGSRAFNVGYIYANLLGNEAGRAIYDGGALIASGGSLIAEGRRFSYKDSLLTTAVIDISKNRMNQAKTASYRPILESSDKGVVFSEFYFPKISPEKSIIKPEKWEKSEYRKEEEFSRAVSLALFDYLRKSYSKGFVVSLSGGADSTAVSVLVYLMVQFAYNELGETLFIQKLSHISELQKAHSTKDWMKYLLITAYQGTRNSSFTTLNAAQKVAEAVNAEFYNLDIDSLVEGYKTVVSKAIDRELSWDKDDITLQNIQARVRAPGIWMFANIRNALLLSTSNRSEAAVGYATMDGDTAGGLSPIAGIDKAFLRNWLKWMEKIAPEEISAISELSFVNEQQPTAELRPSSYHQTDEDDLMPYPILDQIERYAIRDKLMPLDILPLLKENYPDFSLPQLGVWIKRFFTLWSRNQWKRERYAPSFHLDDENLDPKTWCRFPIISGGFKKELFELENYLKTFS
ncbi:NAD(+) synthase [bacterium]|nr:NAD(+) synthase [bacterium]